jgi:hypothetical protein
MKGKIKAAGKAYQPVSTVVFALSLLVCLKPDSSPSLRFNF